MPSCSPHQVQRGARGGWSLPPHRLASASRSTAMPGTRRQGHLRTLTGPVLDRLTHRYAGCSPIVVAKRAPLGGLTALATPPPGRDRIAGVFAQSGSFFRRRN